MKKFTVSIPASSANLGPAFDSAGIALDLYLTLEVAEAEKWEIVNQSPFLPADIHYEDHLIYQIAKKTAGRHGLDLPPIRMVVKSDIPLARGFGSSASAVLAGIEIANQACNLALSPEEKLVYGTEIEGHPDNIAPALFGGFTVTSQTFGDEIDWVKLPLPHMDVVAYIPAFELKTEAARKVLPDNFSRKSATAASSVSNLLIASFISRDYKLAGKMMEQDLFHEPYRSELVPFYHDIRKQAKANGVFGTVISGAGPAMISLAPEQEGKNIAEKMAKRFTYYQITPLKIDQHGVQVTHSMEMAAE
ncbi:homoserine kinase [Lentibacillus sediminis]|uniref:homoserine kinase n=1 Tax=Lentibacillus sediminis TaxID=1940529 RepID=UPI000C1C5701|nr:homoserine kinase [Lentibacillus sediminis]